MINVGRAVEQYINTELGKLSGICDGWHVSSDIIESVFGFYKAKKSPDPMNGVTGQIFLLPVLTKLKAEPDLDSSCFKVYPENVFLRDINEWKNTYLS
jgi:hypothetical protein